MQSPKNRAMPVFELLWISDKLFSFVRVADSITATEDMPLYLTESWYEAYVQVVNQLAKYIKWQMRIAETRGAEL